MPLPDLILVQFLSPVPSPPPEAGRRLSVLPLYCFLEIPGFGIHHGSRHRNCGTFHCVSSQAHIAWNRACLASRIRLLPEVANSSPRSACEGASLGSASPLPSSASAFLFLSGYPPDMSAVTEEGCGLQAQSFGFRIIAYRFVKLAGMRNALPRLYQASAHLGAKLISFVKSAMAS